MVSLARELGLRIGAIRSKLGMTQEDLAFRAGMHLTTINNIECGRSCPTVESLVRIAAALDCEPGDLLHGLALPGAAATL